MTNPMMDHQKDCHISEASYPAELWTPYGARY